jgi:hypothetical protein
VKVGTYPKQFFAGGAGGTQPDGTKTVSFRGEQGTVVRQLHASSPNLSFDGFAINAGGAKLGGSDGAVLELGDFDNGTLKNSTVGNVIDQKGALMDGRYMTVDNVTFHDVTQQSAGVHNECLFIMVPDHLVMRNSTFRNCSTMDVNMNYPSYWTPLPPAFGYVTLENNVFGHSTNGSAWHYYGFVLGGTGPNSGAPACAQGEKSASYMVGWVVRYNTFENTALFEGCAVQSRWVGNLGVWDCVQGMSYSRNVGKACGASDLAVASSAQYAWVNPGGWDFHLGAGSIAIDRGDANDFPATDRDGRARTGVPDAGAYER